jgi:hypothetical protein
VLQVLRPRAVVDEDAVEEDQDEAAEERPEHVVHQCLEHGRRDCQAERHDEELEEALMRPERGLHYVVGVHKNLMIAGPQVELGEEARTAEFVPQLFHHRDRKLVLHRARDVPCNPCKIATSYQIFLRGALAPRTQRSWGG